MEVFFLDKLKSLKQKNQAAYEALMQSIQQGTAKKGDQFVRVGSNCKAVAILQQGSVRHFRYDIDGDEYNAWFSFEGEVVTALRSFVTGESSPEGIEFLEDSEYIFFNRTDFRELTEQYPEILQLYRTMLEEYYIEVEERLYRMQTYSAAQKYAHLVKTNQNIIQRISQKHIASYLGIKKETLSRIKRKS